MNIGKKIKQIRTEKLMTQSELAGDEITRNMLSQIENGSAQPSLSTIKYLAGKLGVPAGYLLSEGDEEFVYNKTRVMKNIKKAYADKSYGMCREMCLSSFEELDDELELILTDCCIGEAEELIRDGKLRYACELLDEAWAHSQNTIYSTVTQRNRAYIMFHLMKSLSPALDSDVYDTDIGGDILQPSLYGDVFCRYIAVIFGSRKYQDEIMKNVTEDPSEYDRLFVAHLKAREYMADREYKKASMVLRSIMDGDTVPQRLLLYICCEDMEKCCKEMEDYKGAYEFSNNKMEILEHMLVDM